MRYAAPLLMLVAAGLLFLRDFRGSSPATPEIKPDGPDLVAVFAANNDRAQARSHAHAFATLCDELANCIEYDAAQAKPRLKTGVAIDDLRRSAREMKMEGASLGTKYPALSRELEAFFTAKVGTWGGRLGDPAAPPNATIANWIAAFRQLARCAEYAALH